MARDFKPGEPVPESGQVEIINARGKGTGVERTVVEGKTFPPTPRKRQRYRMVDRTKH